MSHYLEFDVVSRADGENHYRLQRLKKADTQSTLPNNGEVDLGVSASYDNIIANNNKNVKLPPAISNNNMQNNENNTVKLPKTENPLEISRLTKEDANTIPPLPKRTYQKGKGESSFYNNITEKSKHQAGSVYDENGLAPTLDTMQGGWRQPCIEIKEATKQGFKLAYEGDGVNISSRMKYQRGNVQKESIQTLTTSGGNDRGVIVSKLPGAYGRNFGSKGKIQEKEYCDTLTASMGTGGGNIPIIKIGEKMENIELKSKFNNTCRF